MTNQPDSDLQPLVARIIAELREQPEAREQLLRVLLTDEFLEVPGRILRIEGTIATMQGNISQMQGDISQMQGDISRIEGRMDQMDGRIDRIEGRMDQMDGRMDRMDGRMDRMEADIGALKGTSLEITAANRIQAVLIQRLGLRQPTVVLTPNNPMSAGELESLHRAQDQGRINNQGIAEIVQTDIIIRARPPGGQYIWIAVEVSNTVREDDIGRARERADLLSRAYQQESLAFVAGAQIRPEDQEIADAANVQVVIL